MIEPRLPSFDKIGSYLQETQKQLQMKLPTVTKETFTKPLRIGAESFIESRNPFDGWRPNAPAARALRNLLVTTTEILLFPIRNSPLTALTGISLATATVVAGGLLLAGAALIPSSFSMSEKLHNRALGAIAVGTNTAIGVFIGPLMNPIRLVASAVSIIVEPILTDKQRSTILECVKNNFHMKAAGALASMQQSILSHAKKERLLDDFALKHNLDEISDTEILHTLAAIEKNQTQVDNVFDRARRTSFIAGLATDVDVPPTKTLQDYTSSQRAEAKEAIIKRRIQGKDDLKKELTDSVSLPVLTRLEDAKNLSGSRVVNAVNGFHRALFTEYKTKATPQAKKSAPTRLEGIAKTRVQMLASEEDVRKNELETMRQELDQLFQGRIIKDFSKPIALSGALTDMFRLAPNTLITHRDTTIERVSAAEGSPEYEKHAVETFKAQLGIYKQLSGDAFEIPDFKTQAEVNSWIQEMGSKKDAFSPKMQQLIRSASQNPMTSYIPSKDMRMRLIGSGLNVTADSYQITRAFNDDGTHTVTIQFSYIFKEKGKEIERVAVKYTLDFAEDLSLKAVKSQTT